MKLIKRNISSTLKNLQFSKIKWWKWNVTKWNTGLRNTFLIWPKNIRLNFNSISFRRAYQISFSLRQRLHLRRLLAYRPALPLPSLHLRPSPPTAAAHPPLPLHTLHLSQATPHLPLNVQLRRRLLPRIHLYQDPHASKRPHAACSLLHARRCLSQELRTGASHAQHPPVTLRNPPSATFNARHPHSHQAQVQPTPAPKSSLFQVLQQAHLLLRVPLSDYNQLWRPHQSPNQFSQQRSLPEHLQKLQAEPLNKRAQLVRAVH